MVSRPAGCGRLNARSASWPWRMTSCAPRREKGAPDPAGEAAEVSAELAVPLALVCRVLAAPRSTVYARRASSHAVAAGTLGARPGPVGAVGDDQLVELIRQVLSDSPFCGEGYRKVRARLRREHDVHVAGKRVLRLMRAEGLLAPQRAHRRRSPRPHDGRIVTDTPTCA